MGSPVIAESLAFAGFDGLIIDHEHAPGGLEMAVHQMRAINTTPTTALLRVADNNPMYFKQALDNGAEGILVTNVESGDEAERAVTVPGDTPRKQFERGYSFATNCNHVGLLRNGTMAAIAQGAPE